MTSKHHRRKGIVSSIDPQVSSNSLDWDSPSTITGTVKRRPSSGVFPSDEDTPSPHPPALSRIPSSRIPSGRARKREISQGESGIKWLPLSEVGSYLAVGRGRGKAGKVSDSDSGIASPLSPCSSSGFVTCGGDREECRNRQNQVRKEIEILERCSCVNQQVKVKFCVEFYSS